jgi:hypothetical protein
MGRPPNGIIHIGVLYFVMSLILVKIQPDFGLVLHVSIFMYDVNMIESKCARSGCCYLKHHGFLYISDDLFQHTLVKSLQRLDKAGLEIKEKQYEALSSVENDM